MRSRLLTGVVLTLCVLGMVVTPQAQNANFSLTLIIPADVPYYDAVAQLVSQQLSPLLVDVIVEGSPRPVYTNDLSEYDYDLALVSLDQVTAEYPPLWSLFSPDSFTGSSFYRTDDSFALSTAGIDNPGQLFDLLDQYKLSSVYTQKQLLAFAIQQLYNQEWLLDIPLISTSDIQTSWTQFEGIDAREGLVNSLLLGAAWTSNPSVRSNTERTTSELHYGMFDFRTLSNPLFYFSRADFLSLHPVFSSVFLVDGDNRLQPNLVKAFSKNNSVNESTWTLYLREDIFWSDGEILDAADVKFTYDLVSFPWIAATNEEDWSNLVGVNIVNDTVVQVTFADNALTNGFTLANQYIVPEHILNQSTQLDGVSVHPYNNVNPRESDLWQNYFSSPVTAGPYIFNTEQSRINQVVVFSKNTNYWYPTAIDSPNGIFNLTAATTHPTHYFPEKSLAIDTLVYHVGGRENIDTNTLLGLLQSGSRDVVEFDTLDLESNIFGGTEFRVEPVGFEGGGLTLLINPEGILADFDLRKAITMAINREQMTNLVGRDHFAQLTSVSQFYSDFYLPSAGIEFDYDAARDAFRELGYDALDGNQANTDYEWPWEKIPLPLTPFLLSLVLIVYIRRKK